MDRSAGLIRPVVQSWSANSRNCFLLETISSYTRQTAGTRCQHLDQQPQQQPQQQQQCCNTQELIQKLSSHWSKLQSHAARWSTNSTRQYGSWGTQQLQPVQAAHFSSSTASSSSDGRTGHHEPQQQLHGIHPSQQRLWGDLPSRLSSGTATSSSTAGLGYVEQQQQQQQQAILGEVIVQPMGQEDSNGFRPRALRRKTPQFQVIEFYASGSAAESFIPRTPQELGLHPRDVTLFAPLSRLAAPQRATITVHDGKILVKTEVVKAIITADKAVLIKGRRQHDTQKLAQSILAANDARLKAIQLARHQDEQLTSSITPGVDGGSMMGSCERAASAADLIRAARDKHAAHTRNSIRQVVTTAGGGNHTPPPPHITTTNTTSSSSGSGSGSLPRTWFSEGGALNPQERGFSASGFGSRLQPAGVSAGQHMVAQAGGSELKDVPFESLVLEVLLDATAEYFYTKVQHLNWMLESIAADIRQGSQPWQGGAIDKAHQLIPIQKFMTSLKNDVRETCDAIKAALSDDETLEELCLSWHVELKKHSRWMPVELKKHRAPRWGDADSWGSSSGNGNGSGNGGSNGSSNGGRAALSAAGPAQQVRLLTEMLESYEREIQSLEGSINEAEEDLENTRSIWHMQLDSSRNHIIMVNLWLSIVNISVMGTTILPAFFGMNLSSGLSDADPTFFYAVVTCSLVLAAGSYPVARFWFIRNWKKANQTKLFEQKLLRVLLVQHIEDVAQIIATLRAARYRLLDRKTFRSLMYDTLGNRAMSATNIDFLWEAFDRDRDGFLAEAEHLLPIDNYHGSSGGSNGGSSGGGDAGSSSSAPSPHYADAAHHQHAAAGVIPMQLGSLEGLGARPHNPGCSEAWPGPGPGGESLAQWQARSAVRCSPKHPDEQQQQQISKQQQQKPPQKPPKDDPGSWADDDRFSWD